MVGWATMLMIALSPAAASASFARPVAQIPNSGGLGLDIKHVSADGGRILVTQESDQSNSTAIEALWSVDTAAGTATELLADAGGARYFSLSPAGDWAGWATARPRSSCARTVHVARTDGSTPPTRLSLPDPYTRTGVDGLTVSAGGRVTVRVTRCQSSRNVAILTADPGATTFRVAASSRSGSTRWPVSQDGRVFAMCRPRGSTAQLTVVDSDPELTVRRASLRFNVRGTVSCVASDAGTATMSIIRHRRGASRAGVRHYRRAGVTIGPRGTSRFQLRYGLAVRDPWLGSVSPSGDEVITELRGGQAVVIRTDTGRAGRPFRTPQVILNVPLAGAPYAFGAPNAPWSPFGPVIMLSDIRGTGSVRIVDPHARRVTRAFRVVTPRRSPGARVCFLPSGRVLLDVETMLSASQLVISDARRSRFTRIDASALGVVASASCGAAAAGRLFVATIDNGMIYELDANAVDESPVTL
jgi:hypothetical protein